MELIHDVIDYGGYINMNQNYVPTKGNVFVARRVHIPNMHVKILK